MMPWRTTRMAAMTQVASEKYWSMGAGKALRSVATPAAPAPVPSSPPSTSRLQQVLDLVRGKLQRGGPSTLAEDAKEVQQAIDSIPLEELGVDAGTVQAAVLFGLRISDAAPQPPPPPAPRPAVTYLDIFSNEAPESPTAMTVGIFSLPVGAVIPLHNHPGMTVFSRLLYGSMHVRSYDLVDGGDEGDDDSANNGDASDPDGGGSASSASSSASASDAACNTARRGGGVLRARLVADQVLSAPCPTSALFPTSGGNLHAFTALTPCAVLDVLAPPYSPASGRDCTYYTEVAQDPLGEGAPAAAAGGAPAAAGASPPKEAPRARRAAYVGLRETLPPADFVVRRGVFKGAPVARASPVAAP